MRMPNQQRTRGRRVDDNVRDAHLVVMVTEAVCLHVTSCNIRSLMSSTIVRGVRPKAPINHQRGRARQRASEMPLRQLNMCMSKPHSRNKYHVWRVKITKERPTGKYVK